jgi:hypothetical protein
MADNNSAKVILKKKQINVLVDFCLDESIEFSVKQQTFPDTDWELDLKVKDIKTAILVGMFLRENKLEADGIDVQRYRKSSGKKVDEKSTGSSSKYDAKEEEAEADVKTKSNTEKTEDTGSMLI